MFNALIKVASVFKWVIIAAIGGAVGLIIGITELGIIFRL